MDGFQSYPHDARIWTLCDRFNALQLRVQDFDTGTSAIADDDAFEAAAAIVWAEQEQLVQRICTTAARTDAEIHSKKVSLAVYRGDLPPGQLDRGESAWVRSIAADEHALRVAAA